MKINNEKLKTLIAAIAGVVMYFTPDPVDAVITAVLGLFGITEVFTLNRD